MKRRGRSVLATIGLACLVATAIPSTAHAATAHGALRGAASNKCIDVPDFTAANNRTQVMLWDCTGAENQVWTYTSTKQLLVYGAKCLDAMTPNLRPGSPVIIWECTGAPNQQWNINSDGSISNVQSGLCLDPADNGTVNRTPIQVWTCTGQPNQRWSAPSGTPGTPCRATGGVRYNLSRENNPTDDQVRRITEAMNKAVAAYNCYSSLSRTLNVQFNPWVGTADGNINGTIRFGPKTEYMVQATAMHEISHTFGVGTHNRWQAHISGGHWTGSNAVNELRAITGNSSDVLNVGGGHFWPYGLNHANEVKSPDDYVNHTRMVGAVVRDLNS